MHTSILLQHLHAAQLDRERLDREMLNEQLRIARATRPTFGAQLRMTIGLMLISLGQRLHQAPKPATISTSKGMTVTRTA